MKNDDLETAKQGLIERARKIMALQKRLERAEARLEWSEKTRLEQEERLECAEENLANVLSYKLNMSVSEVSDDDEPQLVWWCGTCEEKLKKKDDEIMDLKERLKDAEESRDRAWAFVDGPIIHSLKGILDGTQEEMKLQRTKRLHIEPS